MKNKKLFVITAVLIAAVLVFSLYNITGNVAGIGKGKCIDSDNTSFYVYKDEPSFYVKGTAKYENRDKIYEDYCVRGAKIKEYYCEHGGLLTSRKEGCSNGCKDGACIK